MRLINCETLELQYFIESNLPPYAILSHVWGKDEVSCQAMQTPERQQLDGFQKIKLCCEQALKNNLRYAWVDTCCIDQTSSAELTEAINSMFKWYAESQVCYAYLSDLDNSEDEDEDKWLSSRWWQRGWTLQELLAPKTLMFFRPLDSSWQWFRDRYEDADKISESTGIPKTALMGDVKHIRSLSIAQRMSWASKRQTTRGEDIAYSLLGLFDVQLPLLYGEGREKAFIRLQEEIIKDSEDESIFAWSLESFAPCFDLKQDDYGTSHGILAPEPGFFAGPWPTSVLYTPNWGESSTYSMTNKGLRIELPVLEETESAAYFAGKLDYFTKKSPDLAGVELAVLQVSNQGLCAAIPIRRISAHGDQYVRCFGDLLWVKNPWAASKKLLFFRKKFVALPNDLALSPALTVTFKVNVVVSYHEDHLTFWDTTFHFLFQQSRQVYSVGDSSTPEANSFLVSPPLPKDIPMFWLNPVTCPWTVSVSIERRRMRSRLLLAFNHDEGFLCDLIGSGDKRQVHLKKTSTLIKQMVTFTARIGESENLEGTKDNGPYKLVVPVLLEILDSSRS